VDHGEIPARRETPSIHHLGGFTCYFLGRPRKIQVHTYIISYQLPVGMLLPSDTFVLLCRTTVGITSLFYKNGPEIN
jgi:hypothetical protein